MSAEARGSNPDDSARKRRWRTPPTLFRTLHALHGYDFDACAEAPNLLSTHITPAANCLTALWGRYGRRAWFNPAWGPKFDACAPDCAKDHVHHAEASPGTAAFVERALSQAPTLDLVTMLLPTAPDTAWWRAAFRASPEVLLLPRVSFVDPDTGIPAPAPPGAGCTIFHLRAWTDPDEERWVRLADVNGRVIA